MTPTLPVFPRRGLAVSAFAAAMLVSAFGADAPPAASQIPAANPRIDWNARSAPWGALRNAPANAQQKAPFKVFDNVYYVGLQTVSVYLITTSDGLVLLDAAFVYTVDQVLENVRTLGFDPKKIKYILVSHAHGDHYAGAGAIIAATGAKVVMSAVDWTVTEEAQARNPKANGEPLKRDVAVKDGDTLNVGDTTFKFYVSPGHTPGALTVEYQARDGARSYRALAPGGLGFNFGPEWTGPYLKSYERLKQLGSVGNGAAKSPLYGPARSLRGREGTGQPRQRPASRCLWGGEDRRVARRHPESGERKTGLRDEEIETGAGAGLLKRKAAKARRVSTGGINRGLHGWARRRSIISSTNVLIRVHPWSTDLPGGAIRWNLHSPSPVSPAPPTVSHQGW